MSTKLKPEHLKSKDVAKMLRVSASLALHEDWSYVERSVQDKCAGLSSDLLEALRGIREGSWDEKLMPPEKPPGMLS